MKREKERKEREWHHMPFLADTDSRGVESREG